jgi:hypothetical protein
MRIYFTTHFDTEDVEVSENDALDLIDAVVLELRDLVVPDVSGEVEQLVDNLTYDYFDNGDIDDSYEMEV